MSARLSASKNAATIRATEYLLREGMVAVAVGIRAERAEAMAMLMRNGYDAMTPWFAVGSLPCNQLALECLEGHAIDTFGMGPATAMRGLYTPGPDGSWQGVSVGEARGMADRVVLMDDVHRGFMVLAALTDEIVIKTGATHRFVLRNSGKTSTRASLVAGKRQGGLGEDIAVERSVTLDVALKGAARK